MKNLLLNEDHYNNTNKPQTVHVFYPNVFGLTQREVQTLLPGQVFTRTRSETRVTIILND
jgi:hypothetical protein